MKEAANFRKTAAQETRTRGYKAACVSWSIDHAACWQHPSWTARIAECPYQKYDTGPFASSRTDVGEVPVPPFASQITLSRRLCRAGPTLPPSLTLCRGPFASHFDVCRGSLRWTAKMGWQMPIAVECSRRCGSVRVSSDADVTPACVSVESHGSCTGFFGQAGH